MAIPGFQDALNRKYDIQQQDANARTALENAQANAIPSSTASENALRAAQAFQTTEQGRQVAPLAGSQVSEARARGGAYGAQANLSNTEAGVQGLGLHPTGLPGALQYTDQVQNNGGTFDQSTGPEVAGQIHDYHTSGGYGPHFGSLGSPAFDTRSSTDVLGQQPLKKGSANVKAKMPPGKAPAAMAGKGGGIASLVASLGAGGAGGAPMPMGQPSPMPGSPPQGAPGPLGFFGGTPQVPGRGSGNVDKVPAMLAPHEAVLTHGAADQLGRGKIAKLNAANPPTPGRGAPPPMAKKPALRKGMV